MRFCKSCRVDIYGAEAVCPLCKNELTGTPRPDEDIFPEPSTELDGGLHRRVVAILAVCSAGAVVVCAAVNVIVTPGRWWALFVLGGVASFWLCWLLTQAKRSAIAGGVLWDVTVVSLLAVGWDIATGFGRWSVDYVVPILITLGVLLLWFLSGMGVVKGGGVVFYQFLLGLYGLAPAILLLTHTATLVIPSVICAAVCLLSLIRTLGMDRARLAPELRRRFHL